MLHQALSKTMNKYKENCFSGLGHLEKGDHCVHDVSQAYSQLV